MLHQHMDGQHTHVCARIWTAMESMMLINVDRTIFLVLDKKTTTTTPTATNEENEMRKRIKVNSEKNGFQRATLTIRSVLLHTRENKWRRAHYDVRSFEWFFSLTAATTKAKSVVFRWFVFLIYFFFSLISSKVMKKKKKKKGFCWLDSSARCCLRFFYLVLFIF